jgi:hypothetical protein
MNHFEDELRAAMRRQPPPESFARRVAARTPSGMTPRRTGWIAAAMAASLLLLMGGFQYRQYQGRKAKQELLLALEITGSKLNLAERKISDWSRRTTHE